MSTPRRPEFPDASLIPVSGRSLLFVIPAYKRVELASICYRQQAACLATLRAAGLEANALVIADDGNLAAARTAGHLTLRAPNQLGAKLNAGFRYAAEHGCEYVCALGSDSWLDPAHISFLPGPGTMLCTRNYVCIAASGRRQGWFRIGYDGGVGSRIFETELLAGCDYQPVEENRASGCDTATLKAIRRDVEPALVYTDMHPFEVVGFQSMTQITPYYRMVERFPPVWQEPFSGLADHYPARCVAAIRRFYRDA